MSIAFTWDDDVPLNAEPLPGEIFVGHLSDSVGPIRAGDCLTMTVLPIDAPPLAGRCYVFDDGSDIAFARVVAVSDELVAVRRYLAGGGTEPALLSRTRWQVRASLTMAPPPS
jgi:hypothetical protein